MYICEICATAFDTPSTVTDTNTDGEHIWRESLRTCPICATAERFHHAVEMIDHTSKQFGNGRALAQLTEAHFVNFINYTHLLFDCNRIFCIIIL